MQVMALLHNLYKNIWTVTIFIVYCEYKNAMYLCCIRGFQLHMWNNFVKVIKMKGQKKIMKKCYWLLHLQRIIARISVLFLAISLLVGFNFNIVQADSMIDLAEDYELGGIYSGTVEGNSRYFCFQISQKSHVSIVCECKGITYDNIAYFAKIYNSSGKLVLRNEDIPTEVNTVSGWEKGAQYRVLPEGTYYIEFPGDGEHGKISYSFRFCLQAEPLIILPKGEIISLKSNKAGQATLKCKTSSDAIGYKIQYSMDYKFKKGVKTEYSPENEITIAKLSKGKRYYFKVCPYNIYDDGEYALGQNSLVKFVKIKK